VPYVSAAERRPQLIRAAIDVMTREGVAAASTRAIAAELGIAQPMVNYVYGSKDELYRAVILQLTADVTAEVKRRAVVPPEADFRAAVAAHARALWQAVVDELEVLQLLNELTVLALRSPSLRGAVADYQLQLDAAFEATFRDAVRHLDTEPARSVSDVARFFFAAIDGLLLHRLVRQADDDADERTLEDLVEATVALAEGRLPVPAAYAGA
jgi:AcrR family transcriptional regulator